MLHRLGDKHSSRGAPQGIAPTVPAVSVLAPFRTDVSWQSVTASAHAAFGAVPDHPVREQSSFCTRTHCCGAISCGRPCSVPARERLCPFLTFSGWPPLVQQVPAQGLRLDSGPHDTSPISTLALPLTSPLVPCQWQSSVSPAEGFGVRVRGSATAVVRPPRRDPHGRRRHHVSPVRPRDTVSCGRKGSRSQQSFRCETSKSLSYGHRPVVVVLLLQGCERGSGDSRGNGAWNVALGHDAAVVWRHHINSSL